MPYSLPNRCCFADVHRRGFWKNEVWQPAPSQEAGIAFQACCRPAFGIGLPASTAVGIQNHLESHD